MGTTKIGKQYFFLDIALRMPFLQHILLNNEKQMLCSGEGSDMDGIRLISESAFEHFMSTALLGIHGMIVIPDAWDQNGQLLKVRYPDLHLTRPQLRVTLDTGSFIDITDEEVEVR